MDRCIATDYPEESFRLFSASHNFTLLIILLICALIYKYRRELGTGAPNRVFRIGLASVLLVQEALAQAWLVHAGEWSAAYSLPLHLCGVSVILSAVLLVFRSYPVYEITYFWGLGGAVQAMLTPDLGPFAFPHLLFYQFFLSHGCIVLACVFMTFAEGFRPTHKSVWKAVAATNIYALPVAAFNYFSGGNYMYLCQKPGNASLIDYLGPWPWYLLSLELVLVAMCYAYYLPFAAGRRLKQRREQKFKGLAGQ